METVIREIRIFVDKKGKFYIPSPYYSDVTYGNNVKSLVVALYSEGVMSNDRITSFSEKKEPKIRVEISCPYFKRACRK